MPEEETKEEEKVVILTTDMHCRACEERINKVLKNFPGVEKIDLDARERKVTVKGKMDARSVFEAVKRKCGKRTLLVYPQLSPEHEHKKEEDKEKLKDEASPDITVELKIRMHCGACAKDIRKMLSKVDGVTEVLEDLGSEKVVVKGKGLDAEKLCQKVRKSGKNCQVIPPPPPPPQKDEKKEEELKGDAKEAEDKTGEKKEEKQEESTGEVKVEGKKYTYPPYQAVHHYIYPPQLFSDENPNACYIM